VNYVTSRQHTYFILYDDSLQFVIVSKNLMQGCVKAKDLSVVIAFLNVLPQIW